ncbi:MAG TPA: hypothetical protein VF392_04670 [Terracidiphilus sp.]
MTRISSRLALFIATFALLSLPSCSRVGAQTAASTETLVIFRHGEKPPNGLGQLTCRGLNRALALPAVLQAKFGRPNFLFAPDPAKRVMDGLHGEFSYVRPLATIEPTAISLGLPVNAQFGYNEIDKLQAELTQPKYASATVFIAWEHVLEERFARNLLKTYGADPRQVPNWSNSEYDMIYVVRLTRANGKTSATFTLDREGLDGKLADQCPVR